MVYAQPSISARWPDLIIVNKKWTCKIVDFALPADHRIKLKEMEKKYKYLELVKQLKQKMEHDDIYTNRYWSFW